MSPRASPRAAAARAAAAVSAPEAEDDASLLERLQRGAFAYIARYSNPLNGLVADTSRAGAPCSIAVVGFALTCYIVAVERGWLSRTAAAQRVLVTLRFFFESSQREDPQATGYKGFYYHFLDMNSGERVWRCELSLIDSTLLIAGVLSVGLYFDRPQEAEIRDTAEALYRRVDWRWAQNNTPSLAQGWLPEFGFLHYGWEGYNEALILYILALGSPTHRWGAVVSRPGRSPTSGNACSDRTYCIPDRYSRTSFRTPGSTFAVFVMALCARSDLTTSRNLPQRRAAARVLRTQSKTGGRLRPGHLGYQRRRWADR